MWLTLLHVHSELLLVQVLTWKLHLNSPDFVIVAVVVLDALLIPSLFSFNLEVKDCVSLADINNGWSLISLNTPTSQIIHSYAGWIMWSFTNRWNINLLRKKVKSSTLEGSLVCPSGRTLHPRTEGLSFTELQSFRKTEPLNTQRTLEECLCLKTWHKWSKNGPWTTLGNLLPLEVFGPNRTCLKLSSDFQGLVTRSLMNVIIALTEMVEIGPLISKPNLLHLN